MQSVAEKKWLPLMWIEPRHKYWLYSLLYYLLIMPQIFTQEQIDKFEHYKQKKEAPSLSNDGDQNECISAISAFTLGT